MDARPAYTCFIWIKKIILKVLQFGQKCSIGSLYHFRNLVFKILIFEINIHNMHFIKLNLPLKIQGGGCIYLMIHYLFMLQYFECKQADIE